MSANEVRLSTVALTIALAIASASLPASGAQAQPTIALLPGAWNHTQLTVLIGSSNSTYVLVSMRAMRSWKIAIDEFGSTSGLQSFGPLSQVSFVPYVQGINASLGHYDITIDFPASGRTECSACSGLENSTVTAGTRTAATISISTQQITHYSQAIFIGTGQSVVAHELGHALGLGHTSGTGFGPVSISPTHAELMFNFSDTSEVPTFPSTLDVYAVASKFQFLFGGSSLPTGNTISLPPSVPYEELGVHQVSISNLPLAIGANADAAVVSRWYPQDYQLPPFIFANFSQVSLNGVNYTFLKWEGFGSGAYNGTSLIPSITVGDDNIAEVAIWSQRNSLNATIQSQAAMIQNLQAQASGLQATSQTQSLELSAAGGLILFLAAAIAVLVISSRRRTARSQ